MISIHDVLLTETTLVTKANPGPGRIWDRYRRGPRFGRILDWSNLGPPHRHPMTSIVKNARESELKQNGTQIQVKETTLQLRGFARPQNHRRSRFC